MITVISQEVPVVFYKNDVTIVDVMVITEPQVLNDNINRFLYTINTHIHTTH